MKLIVNKIKKELIKKGATHVIASLSQDESDQIKFSNNKISTTKSWSPQSIDIFVAIKNKLATTSIKEFDNKTINETVKKLIKIAKISQPNKDFLDIAKGPFKYKNIKDTFDKKIQNLNKAELVKKAINTALNQGAKRASGVLESSNSSVFLTSSENIEVEGKSTHLHSSLRALAEKDASGHLTTTSRTFSKFNYLNSAKEAGTIALKSKKPKIGSSGKYDIIFKPLAFANLLSLIGESSSVFSVESGFSFLKNKINKKIAPSQVNLLDDPTVPNGIGSTKFDAEGHPTLKTPLIQNGTFKTYLHNTSSAKRYKTKNTANAGIISPEAFNLILKKSDWKTNELIKETKKGLIITNLWYTRFKNYATGEFSTIPRDGIFLIENGKIKHPVKGIRISGSLPNILKNIKAIGNNPSQIISWETTIPTTTPEVLVKNVNITKPVE